MLKFEQKENVILICLDSPLDISNSAIVQREINSLIDRFPQCNFIVNLDKVEYINSAGLGVLILSAKRVETNKRSFILTNLSYSVKKVIQILDVNQIIKTYENEDEAYKSLALCP